MGKFNSAVILAGGQSTRMGFDKQMLTAEGRRITDHLISSLSTRFDDIMVASPTAELYDQSRVRVIEDIQKGVGPLGGIHAALVKAKSEFVFVIACDMPYIELAYVDYMISRLQKQAYDACATKRDGYLEGFHAFYNQSALPVLEEEMAQKRYSVQRFLAKINTLIIPEKIAASFLPGWLAFSNLNTPEDYLKFLRGIKK